MPRQDDIDHQCQATCTSLTLSRLAESMGIPEAADPIPPVPPTHFDPPASVQEAFAAAFGRGRDIVRETPTIPARRSTRSRTPSRRWADLVNINTNECRGGTRGLGRGRRNENAFVPASKAAFPPAATLNNEGATVTPATTANEEAATTLNNEEATVAPAATANKEDIAWTRDTIEEVGITANEETTATQTPVAVNEEYINVSCLHHYKYRSQ